MKILFIDMDGTIIHENELLCKKDIEKLKELQDRGYLVVYNTGRTYGQAKGVIELLQLPYDYLSLGNGSHLYSLKEGDIYSYSIDTDKAIDILKQSQQLDLASYYSDGDNIHIDAYATKKMVSEVDTNGIEEQDYMGSLKKLGGVKLLSFYQPAPTIEKLITLKEYIDTHYSSCASAHINVQFLDVSAPNCDKGKGIMYLQEKFDDVETYGIGDSYNDIPMFNAVNHAYTFHRVSDEIKKHTNKQVNYVWEVVEDMLRES